MKIWVDDIRTPPDDIWECNKTSLAAIELLETCREHGFIPDLMSLDHDLGGEDTTRPIVIWMIENDFWPEDVVVHSANSVGIDWLEGMIERYHPKNAEKYAHRSRQRSRCNWIDNECIECGDIDIGI